MASVMKELKHCNADALPKLPSLYPENGHNDDENDSTELYMIQLLDSLPVNSKEMKRKTLMDPLL